MSKDVIANRQEGFFSIKSTDTPLSLGIEDNDRITVDELSPVVIFRFRYEQEELLFKIKRDTKMARAFDSFVAQLQNKEGSVFQNVPRSGLQFLFDEREIEPYDTPRSLLLADYDILDVVLFK